MPRKKSELYEKYAKEHEQSPSAPEALYDAAWRQSALIEIYKAEANLKKSEDAKNRSLALAQKIVGQYGQSDWSNRALTLIFSVQQVFQPGETPATRAVILSGVTASRKRGAVTESKNPYSNPDTRSELPNASHLRYCFLTSLEDD